MRVNRRHTSQAEFDEVTLLKEENEQLKRRFAEMTSLQSFMLEAVLRQAVSAAHSKMFGPPSCWKGVNPVGWWLREQCTPEDASAHDSGIRRAVDAVLALIPARASVPPRSDSSQGQVGPSISPAIFSAFMERELKANVHKGDWSKWKPDRERAASELSHHMEKLLAALADSNRPEAVTEHAADSANICMKIAECYGFLY